VNHLGAGVRIDDDSDTNARVAGGRCQLAQVHIAVETVGDVARLPGGLETRETVRHPRVPWVLDFLR